MLILGTSAKRMEWKLNEKKNTKQPIDVFAEVFTIIAIEWGMAFGLRFICYKSCAIPPESRSHDGFGQRL